MACAIGQRALSHHERMQVQTRGRAKRSYDRQIEIPEEESRHFMVVQEWVLATLLEIRMTSTLMSMLDLRRTWQSVRRVGGDGRSVSHGVRARHLP
jgi:hypothetical protein